MNVQSRTSRTGVRSLLLHPRLICFSLVEACGLKSTYAKLPQVLTIIISYEIRKTFDRHFDSFFWICMRFGCRNECGIKPTEYAYCDGNAGPDT